LTLTILLSAYISSITSFIPLFMVDHFKIKEEIGSAMLSIIYSAGLWAAPLAGHIADRIGKPPVLIAIGFLIIPVVYLMTVMPYGIAFIILLLIFGIVMFARMPASEAFIYENTSSHLKSTIFGVYYFGATAVSTLTTPLLGYAIDHIGFSKSFSISCLIFLTPMLLCSGVFLSGKKRLNK
ncbi:MAG: MFS transporter, partial [Spirochaetota bacterium]